MAGFTRSRWNGDMLCWDRERSTAILRAPRSWVTLTGKTEEGSGGGWWRRLGFIARPRTRRRRAASSPCQRKAGGGHGRDWNTVEDHRRRGVAYGYYSQYLLNCHSSNFSNYSQICMVTQKSPKIKVVPNSKFYNFALTTILKLCLHFKM